MGNKRRQHSPGLRLRGGVWHIQKSVKGYGLLAESTGERDLELAEKYLAMRLDTIRRVHIYGERPAVTFRQAADRYLAENTHLRAAERADYALAHLLPHIGDLDVTRVHDGALDGYRKAREAAGVAANTINKELSYVRRIPILAARVWRHPNGLPWLDSAPLIREAKGPARQPYPLTAEEQRRLFAELPPHLEHMAMFAVHTGVREGELLGLRWAWEARLPALDPATPEAVLPAFVLPAAATKSGRERLVILNRVARGIVESQRGIHADYVFTYEGRPVTRMLNTAWKKARLRAGLPQVRVHDLRHTFGARLRAVGASFEDRQDLLGHTSARGITTHYSAPDIARLVEVAERLCDAARPAAILRVVGAESGQGGTSLPPGRRYN